jgi:molybdopterin biosynthesis enzyme MoaB
MSSIAHRASAPAAVRCFVITVSDTRTHETDTSGRAIIELLTAAGHIVEGAVVGTARRRRRASSSRRRSSSM